MNRHVIKIIFCHFHKIVKKRIKEKTKEVTTTDRVNNKYINLILYMFVTILSIVNVKILA